MTRKGKKLEPKLTLDMGFGEAFERFARTDPKEVEKSIKRAKTKRPPGSDPPRRPARSTDRDRSSSGRSRKPSGD